MFIFILFLIAGITIIIVVRGLNVNAERLFIDNQDLSIYYARGEWSIIGAPPLSEYPQIPTLLFGIDRLLSAWIGPGMPFKVFASLFSMEMLVVLFLVIKVLLEVLPKGLSRYTSLMLLPPVLYFTYNRFDILPAYLCLLAFSAAARKRWTMVSIVLAIAAFTKWYPVLLIPGFIIYASTLEMRFQWKMIIYFLITSIAIVLISYIYGGLETVLAPYQYQMAVKMDIEAFPALVYNLLQGLSHTQIGLREYFLVLLLIQLSGPILIIFIKLDSADALMHYCILVTSIFILFSRIWSPQWFLWILPFLILSTKNMKTAGLLIAYALTTYLCFPLFFDYFGKYSDQLKYSCLVTYFILCIIILRSIANLKFSGILHR